MFIGTTGATIVAKDKWIQDMHMKKGALTKTAQKHHGVTKRGDLSDKFLDAAAEGEYGPKTKKRANLAKNFKKMKH